MQSEVQRPRWCNACADYKTCTENMVLESLPYILHINCGKLRGEGLALPYTLHGYTSTVVSSGGGLALPYILHINCGKLRGGGGLALPYILHINCGKLRGGGLALPYILHINCGKLRGGASPALHTTYQLW